MSQIKLALSINVKAENYILQLIEVDSYKWSTESADELATRSSMYGQAVHVQQLVSFLFTILS
jgi:hypothetical protein